MDYLTSKQLSEKWGIGQCLIIRLAREGRIKGARKYGKSWLFPENTEKPADGRTKRAKAAAPNDSFRFPLYVNLGEDEFVPALSYEEKILRKAQLSFLSCDFGAAEKELNYLVNNCKSIYIRQMSFFFLCWLSAVDKSGEDFASYYAKFKLSLSENTPHNKEMELLSPFLSMILVLYQNAAEEFNFDADYSYSPSVYPLMSYLLFVDKDGPDRFDAIAARVKLYEITVRQLENSGNIFEAELLHVALFVFYYVKADEKSANPHLKSAMEIAYKHNFIYSVADAYPYYKDAYADVLKAYPQEFADRIKESGLKIDKSFSAFSQGNAIGKIFYLLSSGDIKFVLYAADRYSYKEVAKAVHISERTVANRYAKIYDRLGVEGKQGLLEMLKDEASSQNHTDFKL